MTAKTVLVPLDGSKFAESALPVAVGIARQRGDVVELVSVFDAHPTVAGWALSAKPVEEALTKYVDQVTTRVSRQWGVNATAHVVSGDVADKLDKVASHPDVELVVMSTHGLGPLDRLWIGSVASHVIHHGSKPLILVKPEVPRGIPTQPRSFSHILLPLDGSKLATRSVEWATRIGGPDARYTLLHVVPQPILATSSYLPHTIKETREAMEHGRHESEQFLAEAAGPLRAEGFDVAAEVVLGVPATAGIIQYATDHQADLIAITTHGRTGLKRVLLGSVADKVVRASPLPVLLTRAHAK